MIKYFWKKNSHAGPPAHLTHEPREPLPEPWKLVIDLVGQDFSVWGPARRTHEFHSSALNREISAQPTTAHGPTHPTRTSAITRPIIELFERLDAHVSKVRF